MRKNFLDDLCRVLQEGEAADGRVGELCKLERHVQRVFSSRLPHGLALIPIPNWQHRTNVMHTIVSTERQGNRHILTGVAMTLFIGGVLASSGISEKEEIRFRYNNNMGKRLKAFKFIAHDSDRGLAKAEEFFGSGFPYNPDQLRLMESTQGTLACVKNGCTKTTFIIDSRCMVSDCRIDDVRLYCDPVKMAYDWRALYDSLISGNRDEQDDMFDFLFG